MGKSVWFFLGELILLAFLGELPHEARAQDDMLAKIKRLEELEARVDSKLKRLEELEARLEARLETRLQPVAARSEPVVAVRGDGMRGMPPRAVSISAAGATAGRDGKDLEARVRRLEEESIHQVMFRGGFTHLNSPAESLIFTGPKNDTGGWNVGAVIGVKLLRDPFFDNPVLGEVSLDYSNISGNTDRLLGVGKKGTQSLFRVSVTPKYRIDSFGAFRPWITPIGLSFLVNSPPSDSSAYLTVGGTTGLGVEYLVHPRLSLGAGLNYNFYYKRSNRIDVNHLSVGPYIGINY